MNKVYGIEKASLLKRFSAFLLDVIVTLIVATGVMALTSVITKYDDYSDKMEALYTQYEEEYDIKFEMSIEEYEKMTEEEIKKYEEVYEVFSKDEEVIFTYNMVFNLTLLIVTLGCLFGVLITEFIIPLILKNGQTVGKKVFNLCLVKNNGVKINTMMLFVRSFLGKFTIETMIPAYIVILVVFGNAGAIGSIVLILILLIQIVLVFKTENKCLIHDLMAGTVVVDKSSQMIFESEEALIEFKQEFYKKEAESKKYF